MYAILLERKKPAGPNSLLNFSLVKKGHTQSRRVNKGAKTDPTLTCFIYTLDSSFSSSSKLSFSLALFPAGKVDQMTTEKGIGATTAFPF